MARRLPWATGRDAGERAKAKNAPAQLARQEKLSTSDEDDTTSESNLHQTLSPMKLPPRARNRSRETSRTPSTSPPPAPPPAELMHEGYDADDIFMMVEDEFQAVAQTFTRHLHHAEYVRMKKKARTVPPKAISQPLNGMRAEAEKKLEAKNLHKRQTSAVKSMARKTEGSSNDDEEETRGKDPWQGTSLAGLMANDSPRKRTALVGLQQIPSTTRAAKGFGPGERDSRTTQQDSNGDEYVDLDEPLTRKAATATHGKPRGSGIQEPLNNSVLRDAVRPSRAQPTRSNPRSEDVTKAKFVSHDCYKSSKPSSSSLRRTVASFDDCYSEDSHELTTRSNSAFDKSSTTRSKEKRATEKDKRSRLNEIPTFLV